MDFDFFKYQVNQNRLEALKKISNVPISALIWGPDPSGISSTAICRKKLKEELGKHFVYACFSEDLFDPTIQYSNLAQQVAQVDAFDVVFSIPDSPGSIAEIHDFAIIPGISSKIVAFLNKDWNNGYSNQALQRLNSPISCRTEPYDETLLPDCIINRSLELINILKESYFLLGRR